MFRVGIIGMGFGAAVHLPAYSAQSDVKVVALADNGSGRAKELVAKSGGEIRAFASGLSLATFDGLDIVSIAAPPGEQEALVRAALLAGKHVLCEKPFCLGGIAAKELTKLAYERRLNGGVFYELRYDPGIKTLIEMINAGEIGNVHHIAVTWQTNGQLDPRRDWSWRHDAKQGGGVLVDWFIHVVDYASRITHCPIRSLRARATTNVQERFTRSLIKQVVSAPDECEVTCEFESGVTGEFAVSNACRVPVGHRVKVTGDCGSIVLQHTPPFSVSDRSLQLIPLNGVGKFVNCLPPKFEQLSDERIAVAAELIADFILVIKGGHCPALPTFGDGVANWRTIEAALAAVDDGLMHTIDTLY